ncbi:MAG TPA: flagellar biosynthesis protein FlhA [Bryobacteraceae bacterium]|nr:flagellar biosynthesis protein FlhA [Bryobacteraceae bacterium]
MAAAPQLSPVPASPAVSPGADKNARGSTAKPRAGVTSRAAAPPAGLTSRFGNLAEMGVPLAVMCIIMAMIMPLPSFLLDVLISANITLSVIVFLVAMYIVRPVEFSVFPTTLLLLTLFRLALNISSSRLILSYGNTGTRAAGRVIEAFGNFVVGGNYIIGVVIFLVLIAIQYVVINHGAVRISEVTARFTLDALPGKQMSIDSDLNSGLIDESEARDRRRKLAAEAEFYGAMDGASRFTQRDAVASILITTINIVAGFLIGVLQQGMDLRRALSTYTVLTIGDGLVTVIPALMVSVCGGLIVTRASSDSRLGADVRKQVFGNPQPLMLSGGVLIALALLPGMPAVPFLLLGSGVGYFGFRLRQKLDAAEKVAAPAASAPAKENLEAVLRVEPLAVEVGLGLVRLVDGGQNSPLLRRIASIRRTMAADLGYLVPPVRVTDNLQLKAGEYSVLLKGVEIARFEMMQNCELAIHPALHHDAPAPPLEGVAARDPAFGIAALWIPSERADHARSLGYTVVDAVGVLGTHLAELIRRHAHEMLTRQDAKNILDRVAQEHPKVVEDLVPKLLPLSSVQKVLQNLLRERVSIRDAATVLEALGEAAPMTKNPILLTEYARQAIRRLLVKPYLNATGELPAFFVDPAIEQVVEGGVEYNEHSGHLNLPPQKLRDIVDRVARAVGAVDTPMAALTSSSARYFLRQILEGTLPNLAILSHNEIPAGVRVVSVGVIQ